MRIDIVPHQLVMYKGQQCTVVDLDDADESALLDNGRGTSIWVDYEAIAAENPDLEIEDEYEDWVW